MCFVGLPWKGRIYNGGSFLFFALRCFQLLQTTWLRWGSSCWVSCWLWFQWYGPWFRRPSSRHAKTSVGFQTLEGNHVHTRAGSKRYCSYSTVSRGLALIFLFQRRHLSHYAPTGWDETTMCLVAPLVSVGALLKTVCLLTAYSSCSRCKRTTWSTPPASPEARYW